MAFHPYNMVACVATVALYHLLPTTTPRARLRSFFGSILVGFIWPVLIPMGLYFGTKVKILGLPFRSDWVLALEITGCLIATAVGLTIYLLRGVS